VRVRGIDHPPPQEPTGTQNPYIVGDAVWVRPPGNRCNTRFTRGTVTKVISDLAVEVNGVPRHVRDLRCVTSPDHVSEEASGNEILSDDDNLLTDAPLPLRHDDSGSDTEAASPLSPDQFLPRRSYRERRPPDCYSP